MKNKLEDGKFHSHTIDGVPNQNNSSEYYCMNEYGCFYNWYTSTAGTGTTSVSTEGANLDYSICPSGWTLPTKDDFVAMATSYGYGIDADATVAIKMLVVNPTTTTENINGADKPGLLLGGEWGRGGSGASVGSTTAYWSRTAYSAQFGHGLYIDTTKVASTNVFNKYDGRPIRCVLK